MRLADSDERESGDQRDAAIVVVGAGQSGFQVAASLRDNGHRGRIVLIGEEPGLPYQRPPLSKAYLTGKADEAALRLRSESFYAERGIELRAAERAVAIDRVSRRVCLGSGAELAYGHLVLATGSRNRPLPVPGAELDGVFQLRTLADAEALRSRLAGLRRAVVVGAGFIGLEFAAVAASLGIAVTVLEARSRPMSRMVSGAVSDFFGDAHAGMGVRLEFGAVATRILRSAGRATGVETADGREVAAELVLVGIGVVPNDELAAAAGLAVSDGVVVDAHLRTSDPRISAIGDCARFPDPVSGGLVRLESVQNGVDQARCVAARLCGGLERYAAVPWFWSDQGPYKLQIAGLGDGSDGSVLRGKPSSGAFSVFRYRDDRLVSVESVNRPADHMLARRLLASGTPLPPEHAADLSVDLKALWAALAAA